MTYQAGHIKHNADTLDVAVRTSFPEDDERLAQMAWVVAGPNSRTRHASTDKVADWADLYIPPAAESAP